MATATARCRAPPVRSKLCSSRVTARSSGHAPLSLMVWRRDSGMSLMGGCGRVAAMESLILLIYCGNKHCTRSWFIRRYSVKPRAALRQNGEVPRLESCPFAIAGIDRQRVLEAENQDDLAVAGIHLQIPAQPFEARGGSHRLRHHEIQVHARAVEKLTVNRLAAVKLQPIADFPQCSMLTVVKLEFDAPPLQQHHVAVVSGEIREGPG